MNSEGSENGFALLIVIMGLAVLAIIAAAFMTTVNTQVHITSNIIDSAKAETLANAGVEIATIKLATYAKGRNLKNPDLPVNGTPIRCSLGEGNILTLIIWDEGGKIDLNAASYELLKTLVSRFENDSQKVNAITSAIIDFRDTNELKMLNGAEANEYQAAGLSYGPKNSRFDSIEELEQVIGLSTHLYKKLVPYVTIYSRHNGIDPNIASFAIMNLLSQHTQQSVQSNIPLPQNLLERGKGTSHSIPRQYILPTSRKFFRIIAAVETPSGGRYARDAIVEFLNNSHSSHKMRRWMQADWPYLELKTPPSTTISCN